MAPASVRRIWWAFSQYPLHVLVFTQNEIMALMMDQEDAENSSLHVLKELEVWWLGFPSARAADPCLAQHVFEGVWSCQRCSGHWLDRHGQERALHWLWQPCLPVHDERVTAGLLPASVLQCLGPQLRQGELEIPFIDPFPCRDGSIPQPLLGCLQCPDWN